MKSRPTLILLLTLFGLSSCTYPRVADRMDGASFVRETVPRVLYSGDSFFKDFNKHVKEDSRNLYFHFMAYSASVPHKFKFTASKREFLLALLEDYAQTLKKLSAVPGSYKPSAGNKYSREDFLFTKALRTAALFAALEKFPEKFKSDLRRFYFWLAKTERFDRIMCESLRQESELKKSVWALMIRKTFK